MTDKPEVSGEQKVHMGFRVPKSLHSRFMSWLAGRKYQDVFIGWIEDVIDVKKRPTEKKK